MPVTVGSGAAYLRVGRSGIAGRGHAFSRAARGGVPNQSPRVLTHPRSLWHVRPVLALSSHLLSCLSMPPRIGAVQGWAANDFVRNLPATHRSTNGTVIPVNGLDNRCAHSERALVTLSTTNLAPTAPWGARYLARACLCSGYRLAAHRASARDAPGAWPRAWGAQSS
mgnify:CR=1 FL=1